MIYIYFTSQANKELIWVSIISQPTLGKTKHVMFRYVKTCSCKVGAKITAIFFGPYADKH